MSNNDHFIVPVSTYLSTFLALIFLTVLTVVVAQFDFGPFNIAVALFVACIKASLVIGFFMGLHWDRGFIAAFFLSSLLAIALFFLFVFADVGFRGATEVKEKGKFGIKSPVKLIDDADRYHSTH
ncbi:MAG: cytochrome C oxidase subunit IV family protein [bacterium]